MLPKTSYDEWHDRLAVDHQADAPWHRPLKDHLSAADDLAGKFSKSVVARVGARGRTYIEEGQPINNFLLLPRTRRMIVKAGLKVKAVDEQTLTIGEKPAG